MKGVCRKYGYMIIEEHHYVKAD